MSVGMPVGEHNLYSILGIERTASAEELRHSFKRQALACHPDKPGGSKEAFQTIMVAFETLSDPERRKKYDQEALRVPAARSDTDVKSGSQIRPTSRRSWSKSDQETSRQRSKGHNAKRQTSPSNFVPAGAEQTTLLSTGSKSKFSTGPQACSSPRKPSSQQVSTNFHEDAAAGPIHSQPFRDQQILAIEAIFEKMSQQFRILLPAQRRVVLLRNFTQQQRLALEHWMLKERAQEKTAPSRHALRVLGPGDDDFSDDSWSSSSSNEHSHESGESCGDSSLADEIESGGLLALDDMKAVMYALKDNIDVQDMNPMTNASGACQCNIMGSSSREAAHIDSESDCHPSPVPSSLGYAAPIESQELHTEGSGKHSLRGLVSFSKHGGMYYRACVCVSCIELVTRQDKDLSTVLDFHVALLAIKQKTSRVVESGMFGEVFRKAVYDVIEQHGLSFDGMGLRFSICIWPAWLNMKLSTPATADIDVALRFWQQVRQGRQENLPASNQWMFFQRGPDTIWNEWVHLRNVYVDAWESAGRSRESLIEKLDRLESARKPRIERLLELWNQSCLAREERRQRAFVRLEQRRERIEMRRMQREDRAGRYIARRERKQLDDENVLRSRAERQILRLLVALTHREKRLGRFEEQQRLKQARQKREEIKRKRQERDEEARLAKRSRELKWKWMNRRDITMNDLIAT